MNSQKPIFDHGTTIADSTKRRQKNKRGVGYSHIKVDAYDKATGKCKFADDFSLPGMLVAKIKRSIKAHAKIISIDTSKALEIPGVKAIITGQDLPTKYGIIPWTKDEQPLCTNKVRYIGDAVAAVAAIDEETANLALKHIKITYEDLTPILNTEQAKITGDTEQSKVNEKAKKQNITKKICLKFGETNLGFEQSDVVLENDFYYSNTTHAAIEPHCALSEYNHNGRLSVTSSTQVPHYLHRSLSEVLGLAQSQIRVIQPPLGGAFGGKSEPFDLEFVVAKLAMITGKPVKCLYTREEVFYAHRGRHPMKMHLKTGATKDGILKAVENKIDIDGGAYASFGMITSFYAGQLLTGPVGFENYSFNATRFYTNKPACGPKRGHGSVQPRFAFEIHLDMLASKLNIDPIELRKKNFVGEQAKTINEQQINSLGLVPCLDAVAKASNWQKNRYSLPKNQGMGVASSMYISGTNYPIYPNKMPQSSVNIKIDRSGLVTMFSGVADLGQGCDSILAQIACEELGVSFNNIKVITGDSDLCPVDLGSYSSRVTLMMGLAAQEACRNLREKIQEAVAKKWGGELDIHAKDIFFGENKIWYSLNTELNMSLAEAFCETESLFGAICETGGYRTKAWGGKYKGGSIGASPAYSCTAHIAKVLVDTDTGKIDIKNIWVAHDCGKAINPCLVKGQIEGSTYMGVAEVCLEEMVYGDESRAGILVGPSLLDYKIPTTRDTPDIESLIVEQPDQNGPYGAKEAGEGPLHSAIPAVANAVYDAVGIRLFELPFTPAKVLHALKEKQNA